MSIFPACLRDPGCLKRRSPAWSLLVFGLTVRKVKEVLLGDLGVVMSSCGENSLKVKLVDIKAFFCTNSLWWHLEAEQTGHSSCACVWSMCDYMWSGQLLNIKGCSHLCCHPCWFLRSAYMGIWLQGMMWRTTRGGLKRQMKMRYGAWFQGRWHNGGKQLKRRLGSIGWKEVSLTKGLKGGDCRRWHLYRHYREEECFCIWSSWYRWDGFSSHSWQTDRTGQVWGSASWHIQEVTLNDSVCAC